jgi:type I restriction enzyme M protein
MPEALFKTSGKGGTHAKVVVALIQNTPPSENGNDIFMAEALWCGHDSRGNPTLRTNSDGTTTLLDDVPLILDRFIDLYGSADAFWESS